MSVSEERFLRTEMCFGSDNMKKLSLSRIAVFGLGGVGGHAAEALVRSGIGALDLIDADSVSESNLNRQIIATAETLGMLKTQAAYKRFKSINPDVILNLHSVFFLPSNSDRFDFSEYDYVIDAIDTVSAKLEIVSCCSLCGTPVISSMGTGNKINPSMLEIADIYSTSVCPLARVMRIQCRKRNIKALKVVYSKEEPITPDEALMHRALGNSSVKKAIPSSNSFVPATAGLLMASEVIRDILKKT